MKTRKEIIIYKKECYNEPYCSLNQVLEQLKAKEQELKNICKAFDIEYVIDKETGNLIGRCNKLYKKEQECERYKQLAGKHCVETINMQRELDQLKQTNEELQKDNKHLSEKEEEARHYLEEAQKFKNCLAEIKEIAECCQTPANCKDYCQFYNECIDGGLPLILQKISEVENAR